MNAFKRVKKKDKKLHEQLRRGPRCVIFCENAYLSRLPEHIYHGKHIVVPLF